MAHGMAHARSLFSPSSLCAAAHRSVWPGCRDRGLSRRADGIYPLAIVPLLRRRLAAAAAAPTPATAEVTGGGEAQLPRVVLKGGKSKLFSDAQSPMVYSGAVDRVVGRPAPKRFCPRGGRAAAH